MSFSALLRQEFKAIFSDSAITLTIIFAVLLYAVLYPLPYNHQVPTEQPIIVIDHDNSTLSRQFILDADASPKIKIVNKVNSINDAETLILAGKAKGLLVIPSNFKRDLFLGKGVTLSYAGDASYMLVYSAVMKGLVVVGLETGKKMQRIGLYSKGANKNIADLNLNPIKLNSVPAFNPSLGYTPYLVPGLFLLILHQTLLIGIGILGAGQWGETAGSDYWKTSNAVRFVTIRIIAFFIIYCFLASLYVGYGYYAYNVSLLAKLSHVLLLLLPFLLSTCALGVFLSTFFNRRERPTQVFLLTGTPILFVAGFIWPVNLIPLPLTAFAQIIPAVPSIIAMLKLNQLGAPWESIFISWLQLWALFIIFFIAAVYRLKKKQKEHQVLTVSSVQEG
ncbi:MAG TPA: ABC transporter permease [Psychromonas hadalis]|nr:ABC transporter permease [Psychromonas hadalis]